MTIRENEIIRDSLLFSATGFNPKAQEIDTTGDITANVINV